MSPFIGSCPYISREDHGLKNVTALQQKTAEQIKGHMDSITARFKNHKGEGGQTGVIGDKKDSL